MALTSSKHSMFKYCQLFVNCFPPTFRETFLRRSSGLVLHDSYMSTFCEQTRMRTGLRASHVNLAEVPCSFIFFFAMTSSMKEGLLQNTVNPLGITSQSEVSTPSALSKSPSPLHGHIAVEVQGNSRIPVVGSVHCTMFFPLHQISLHASISFTTSLSL